MKPRFGIAVLLLAAPPAIASQIETSVLCEVDQSVVTDVRTCRVGDLAPLVPGAGGSHALSTVNEWSLSSSSFSAGAVTDVVVRHYRVEPWEPIPLVHSLATVSGTIWLEMAGPPRDGLIDLALFFGGDGTANSLGAAAFSVGPYFWDRGGRPDTIVRGKFPMRLGQPFAVTLWLESEARNYRDEYEFGQSAYAFVGLALYEADGVSQVRIFESGIPEPAHTAIGGLLAIVFLRLISRRTVNRRIQA